MEFENIILKTSGHVAVITLNRPQSLNAVTSNMLLDINSALEKIESDKMIRALVLTGGEKVFAAGFDIKEILTIKTPADANLFLSKIHLSYNRLADLEIPVIAAASGLTFGGGFELALACDFRIASDTAKFALPEINLGLIPGAGGTQRLPRIIGMGRANEMLFTGRPVSAQKALEMGLVNCMTTPDSLIDKAIKMAEQVASKPGFALKIIKKVVQTGMNTDLTSALDNEARCFEMLFSTRDQKEGVAAFVEKRRPDFKGY
ncbi:enoyl-CoA hydratase/isomerase family protein [Desulfobacula sp.]|uniref:enoyl-CoA hydratase/isomerase family protein n=1 Tax=Desulfobacula sp. TaxID=2593537 RepID=UPI00261BAA3E|nr:enoyl-CoA hydratase/isomerase family protein [Desulfobacula sp.]